MILIIRGHIRNSFSNYLLKQFVNAVVESNNQFMIPTSIYIHTWDIIANNLSWRQIQEDGRHVSPEMIYAYFGEELKSYIKNIMIENDANIQLIGNLEGTINHGPMPIKGWKNYWYGKYRIAEYLIQHVGQTNDETVVNMRFDLFSNSNNFPPKRIFDFIQENRQIGLCATQNVFLEDKEVNGIDNVYMGNCRTMVAIAEQFHYHLDEILQKHNDTINQERLVFRMNKEMWLD